MLNWYVKIKFNNIIFFFVVVLFLSIFQSSNSSIIGSLLNIKEILINMICINIISPFVLFLVICHYEWVCIKIELIRMKHGFTAKLYTKVSFDCAYSMGIKFLRFFLKHFFYYYCTFITQLVLKVNITYIFQWSTFGNLIVLIFFRSVHYKVIRFYSVGVLLATSSLVHTRNVFVINGAQIFKLQHPWTIFLVVIKHLQTNILPQQSSKTKNYNGYK